MPNTPEVHNLTPNHCFAIWDSVLILIWRSEVTPEAIRNLAKMAAFCAESRTPPLASLTIVQATSPPPSEQMRPKLAAFHREINARMISQIVVAEGSGFRVALVRSIGVALSAISPKSLPFKFASTLDEAAVLIEPLLSAAAGGREGLKRAIRELRDGFPP